MDFEASMGPSLWRMAVYIAKVAGRVSGFAPVRFRAKAKT